MDANMDDVTWVPVKGYEGLYEVSSDRQVRLVPRDVLDKDGNVLYHIPEKDIPVRCHSSSNPYVVLYKSGKSEVKYISEIEKESF